MPEQRLTQSFVSGAAIGGIIFVLVNFNAMALITIWLVMDTTDENTDPVSETCSTCGEELI